MKQVLNARGGTVLAIKPLELLHMCDYSPYDLYGDRTPTWVLVQVVATA